MAGTVERVPLPLTSTPEDQPTVAPVTPVPQPDARGPAYEAMRYGWEKVDGLLGGTQRMAEFGQAFLPMHPREKEQAYLHRLRTNWLFPGFTKALNDFVGKVFEKKVKVLKSSAALTPVLDDMDRQGNNVTVFCRNLFYNALAKGKTHIQVDFPDFRPLRAELAAAGRQWSRVEDEKVRPYFIEHRAPAVIGWQYDIRDGSPELRLARIREVIPRPRTPFDDVSRVERIRVLYSDHQEVWERVTTPAPAGSPPNAAGPNVPADWRIVDDIPAQISGVVPLVPVYTDLDHGLMTAETPLMPIVDMNHAHWRSNADQVHAERVARIPILFYAGATREQAAGTIEISPDDMLATDNSAATLAYVGGAEGPINLGAASLKDLETRMEAWSGAQMTQQPGNLKATAMSLQTAQSGSVLSSWVQGVEDAMNAAFDIADEAMGNPSGSTRIEIYKPLAMADMIGDGAEDGSDTSSGSAEGGSPQRPAGGQAGA